MGDSGWLFGCDRDEAAIQAATDRLRPWKDRVTIRRGRFDELPQWVPAGGCDGVVLDLGVSSPQLDEAERGFSFQRPGPLDMRMDQRQTLTAATIVNEWDEAALAKIFWEFGGERQARRVARRIVEERMHLNIDNTHQLARLVECAIPRGGGKIHPATRVFQALRLAVNGEIEVLRRGLPAVWDLLKPGGRLAVITFHSLEVQEVREFVRRRERDYETAGAVDVPELRVPKRPDLRRVNRKAIQPTAAEVAANPRARSAQLRVMERI